MALTDAQIKNAKPAARDYKLFDNDGLSLQVTIARLDRRADGSGFICVNR